MILKTAFVLAVALQLAHCQEICFRNENSQSFICPKNQKCCPEGCCLPFLTIPKISIILVLNILSFMIILCFLCWLTQYLLTICRKYGLIKNNNNGDKTPSFEVIIDLEDKPPSYEEAILNR